MGPYIAKSPLLLCLMKWSLMADGGAYHMAYVVSHQGAISKKNKINTSYLMQ